MSDDKKYMTPRELKTWLTGVMDFQPEGWSPNSEQWDKILEKINSLADVPETLVPEIVTGGGVQSTLRQSDPRSNPNPKPPIPLSLDSGTVKLPPERERPPDQVVVQKHSPPTIIDDGGRKVIDTGNIHKTGVIDTSGGNYTSQFK